MSRKTKVFVGISGGVDSAVSAYLLKKEGFGVVGCFIKTWQPDFIKCTWKEERRDAMRVCAHLEIPFITIDLEKEYKKHVGDYLVEEYKKGRTPNPDIMCNKEIKFGAFFKKALELGADFIATGHYAKIIQKTKGKRQNFNLKLKEEYELQRGKDPNKDQSYFMWTLKQEQLSKILFPLGNLKKKEVRKIAEKIKLPNFDKKDSQGVCMLGDFSIKDFLYHFIRKKEGKVLNTKGEVVGRHNGAVFLTIGERHGFTIIKKSPNDPRFYILSKDLKKNTIIIGNELDLKKETGGIKKEFEIENINWINKNPEENKKYLGQIRYRQEPQDVILKKEKKTFKVIFEKPQSGASGQSIVIYEGKTCLGGGIIV